MPDDRRCKYERFLRQHSLHLHKSGLSGGFIGSPQSCKPSACCVHLLRPPLKAVIAIMLKNGNLANLFATRFCDA
jgi:hypothetical protein